MVNRYGRMTSETMIVNSPDATVTINNSTLTHVAVTETGSNVDYGDSEGHGGLAQVAAPRPLGFNRVLRT